MLFGTECWTVKSQQDNKLNVADIIMLHWMSRHTRQSRINNESLREKSWGSTYGRIMAETRLCCFGHVWRKLAEVLV